MASHRLSRRQLLQALTVSVATRPGLTSAHSSEVETAGQPVSGAPQDIYRPKLFNAHQYHTLEVLCEEIIPSDEHSAGAIEAGVPQFIDLLASDNQEFRARLGGGLIWLDSPCKDRYRKVFVDCSPQQRQKILDQIAYRRNVQKDPQLRQGIDFFSFVRDPTADGFYTSPIGIKDLRYKGNTYVAEFPGCPWRR